MKYTIDGHQYDGTPQEIAEFLALSQPIQSPFETPSDGFAPLRDIVSESEQLRRELAKNADYNPYGGVVPPKEAMQENTTGVASAEKDTGVELI